MSETMRAATIVRPGELEIREVPVPDPGPQQVLVALEGTGVCASNLPLWDGAPWFSYPLEPGCGGHEGWGVIRRVGEGVDERMLGQRVAALSFRAYAEYDVANANQLVPLPRALDKQPVPGEALGCAMNILARADLHADQTLAIVGIGFLGALLTQLASQAGLRVIAISRRRSALDLARKYGAFACLAMEDHQAIVERVKDLTDGRMCPRVIEAAGHQWPLDLASELTGEHGRLIIAGYHQDGARQVNMQLWNWRGIDVINAHERNPSVSLAGMQRAIAAITEGRLDPSLLYSHRFPLAALGAALTATREKPEGFFKALVCMEQAS
jgi:threonine dehydrogenase-like Zn-dependent dehydrogenase